MFTPELLARFPDLLKATHAEDAAWILAFVDGHIASLEGSLSAFALKHRRAAWLSDQLKRTGRQWILGLDLDDEELAAEALEALDRARMHANLEELGEIEPYERELEHMRSAIEAWRRRRDDATTY